MNEDREAQVHWRKKERTMTLEGERVLSYCLSWPEEENCRRITRYYARAARLWQDRWEKHLYPLACLELVRCREQAGVFIPWRCEMTGKLAFCGRGLVSVVLTVREMDRPGRSRTVVKGITWRLKDGRPLPMGELLAPEQRRKKQLTAALAQAAEELRRSGSCVLDRDAGERLFTVLDRDNVWQEGDWTVWAFPQCSIAPAAEGCPILRVPAAAAGHKNAAEGNSAVKGGQSSEKSSSVRPLKSAFTGRGGTRFIGSYVNRRQEEP